MLQSEFEELWGDPITCIAYKEVIEPMYLATPEYVNKVDFVNMLEPPVANERSVYNRDSLRHQKALFVKNLGRLLRQTRLGIQECEYSEQDGEEFVVVRYETGQTTDLNITGDSFIAIIRDVCRRL